MFSKETQRKEGKDDHSLYFMIKTIFFTDHLVIAYPFMYISKRKEE